MLAQVEPIRIFYHSAEGCPDKEQFLAKVTSSTDRTRQASVGEPARTFDVDLVAESGEVRGVLRITANGSESRREVAGRDCGEVVAALALITALAVDPAAKTGDLDSPRAGSTDAPRAPPANEAPPPAMPSSRAALPATSDSVETLPDNKLRLAVGVEGEALAGIVPDTGVGGGAFVDLTRESPGPLVLSLRASLLSTAANPSFDSSVGAQLVWILARLEACPLRFPLDESVALGFCAALDAGALRSQGQRLASRGSDTRPWLAPAALARLMWEVTPGAWIEGSGGLTFPLDRYSFYYQRGGSLENVQVSQAPVVGGVLALGAGYRFQ